MVLLAQWNLDEGPEDVPTTAIDSAAGGSGSHDGTYTLGGKVAGGLGPWHLTAASSNYVTSFLNDADLHLLGEMTVMCWYMKPGNDYWGGGSSALAMVGSGSSGSENYNYNYLFDFNGGEDFVLRWESAEGVWHVPASGTGILSPWGWNHVAAARYDIAGNLGVKFYVDGQLVMTDDNGGPGYSPPTNGTLSEMMIGRYGGNANTLMAHMCELRIYDEERSQAQIEAVYDAGLPSIEGSIVGAEIPKGFERATPHANIYAPRHMGLRNLRDNSGFHR